MLRRVRADVSEELRASFIRVTRIGELGMTLAVISNRSTLRRNSSVFHNHRRENLKSYTVTLLIMILIRIVYVHLDCPSTLSRESGMKVRCAPVQSGRVNERYCIRRKSYSGMWRRVALVRTDVLEESIATIIRVKRTCEL
jgi:hypothetical protein